MTLIQPYIKNVKLGMDKLTGSASFGYIMSNEKDSKYESATAWEGDVGVQYKLADNVAYFVDGGYANISYDKKGVAFGAPSKDPDPIMLLKHQILFTF
jgi:predicted porin